MPEARLQKTREAYCAPKRVTFKGIPLYFDSERCACGAILPLREPHQSGCVARTGTDGRDAEGGMT